MPTNNAKPRAKTAHSSASKHRASISSLTNRSAVLRRSPIADESANAAAHTPAEGQAHAPQTAQPSQSAPAPSKRPHIEKPIAIDEALRKEGMGPRHYARRLKDFVESVTAETDPKLALDGLKEWGRHLETKRSAGGSSEPEAPVMVQLVHAVPRPDRAGSETLDSKKEPS
jgi:hypothetical protein